MSDTMQLDQLILKYLSGNLTPDEQETLFQWRDASDQNKQRFARLTDAEWLATEFKKISPEGTEQAWQKLGYGQENNPAKVLSIKKRNRWIPAAAAVLLLFCGAATWWILKPVANKDRLQAERFHNDVLPGKEGAVLTLADGTKLLLDSMGNGLLKNQAEASIKKEEGQLTYQAIVATAGVVHHTITTPKGRKFRVVLADGTIVWLNAESSITFPTAFIGNAREVEIKGEAFFSVTHTGKPFFAKMDGMQVEVLGTRFNMNNYGDEDAIKTTLAEGKVRAIANRPGISGDLTLVPGQQAVLYTGKQNMQTSEADLEQTLAWTNNLFYFHNAGIEQIMNQLKRWYDIDIIYEEKVEQHFSGTIPMDVNITTVLKILELTKGVKFMVEGRKITVMRS